MHLPRPGAGGGGREGGLPRERERKHPGRTESQLFKLVENCWEVPTLVLFTAEREQTMMSARFLSSQETG